MDDWASVYEEHVEYVFRFLMYYLGNRQEAEDIAQETFIKAFGRWEQFDKRSGVRTWLVAIARNLAVDRVRKNQRGKLLQVLFRREATESAPLPEEFLSHDETRRELYVAIQGLKPDYRAVVILKGIQEYSNLEVAAILGWSESKVKVTFHRAVKSLGATLVKDEEEAYGLV